MHSFHQFAVSLSHTRVRAHTHAYTEVYADHRSIYLSNMSLFRWGGALSLKKSSINMCTMNSRIQLELEPTGSGLWPRSTLGCVIFGLESVFFFF